MTTSSAPLLDHPGSDRVRMVRSLGRRSSRERAGLFLAEGPQAVREVVRWAPDSIAELFVECDGAGALRHPEIVEAAVAAGVRVRPATPRVLAAMADTEAPAGLLATCRPVDRSLADVLSAMAETPGFLVVLAQVRDPGNAGTVIRAADAAGARGVILTRSSVDLTNPKLVRSTAGSLWHLPISVGGTLEQIATQCRAHGIRLLGADGHADLSLPALPDAILRASHAWVMGNEAWGLPEDDRALCDMTVAIPIYGKAESLNLGTAAAVCLYASASAHHEGA